MILVHICCSVDSHFFLQELRSLYPQKKLIGFFYDPNIHPYSEYILRLMDVKRSCKELGIELIEGEYDYLGWLESVRGLESEPEKGDRCLVCFDNRVKESMKKAVELGIKEVTTTLLISPKKSIQQLQKVGNALAKRYGVKFLSLDFRKNGGTQRQFKMAKEQNLYHQNYCGCIYALKAQRDAQNRVADELFEPISRQILPNSIDERINLYEKVHKLKEDSKKYEIIRSNFINYRVLRAYIKVGNNTIPSYFIFYSYLKRKKAKLKIAKRVKDIFFSNRENIKIVELQYLNKILNKNYENIKELDKNTLKIDEELYFRRSIEGDLYSLSPIVIVDKAEFDRFEIYLDAIYYNDVRENLVIF